MKQTLLILGATGDLTARLLLPGLVALVASGGGEQLLLVGSGRVDWDHDRWRQRVADSFAAANAGGAQVDAVVRGARCLKADVTVEDDLRRLLDACRGRVAIFLALPPAVTVQACQALAGIKLPQHTRLVLEKPFGINAASAAALNDLPARLVPEDQVYRVDHYLGMSTVLNIVGLRFANRMLESVLNGEHIHSIDIIFEETLALEGRAGYYDGAARWSTFRRFRPARTSARSAASGMCRRCSGQSAAPLPTPTVRRRKRAGSRSCPLTAIRASHP